LGKKQCPSAARRCDKQEGVTKLEIGVGKREEDYPRV